MSPSRRPAWYAARRLSWLLARARDRRVVQLQERGLPVVGFRLRDLDHGPAGEPLGGTFQWAWLAWLDQYADSTCLDGDEAAPGPRAVVQLLGATSSDPPVLLPVVPVVVLDTGSTAIDGAGYRAVRSVSWDWQGFDAALRALVPSIPGIAERVYLDLDMAGPGVTLAPVCLLTGGTSVDVAASWP